MNFFKHQSKPIYGLVTSSNISIENVPRMETFSACMTVHRQLEMLRVLDKIMIAEDPEICLKIDQIDSQNALNTKQEVYTV